jgi:hypothetical protein
MENFNEIVARYKRGDLAAGRQMDAAIQARIAATNESYTVAMRILIAKVKTYVERPPEATVQQRYAAGAELVLRTKEIGLNSDLDYSAALTGGV